MGIQASNTNVRAALGHGAVFGLGRGSIGIVNIETMEIEMVELITSDDLEWKYGSEVETPHWLI